MNNLFLIITITIKKSFLFMDTNKYIIINNPNEVNVNNAYNALKTLYKSVYRANELLAYKALAKAINEGILAEIENNWIYFLMIQCLTMNLLLI